MKKSLEENQELKAAKENWQKLNKKQRRQKRNCSRGKGWQATA